MRISDWSSECALPIFWTDPLMYQGGSDRFLAPAEAIRAADEAWGIDFEAEVAVVTDDVPMGVSASDAAGHITLVKLVHDVSLRGLKIGSAAWRGRRCKYV